MNPRLWSRQDEPGDGLYRCVHGICEIWCWVAQLQARFECGAYDVGVGTGRNCDDPCLDACVRKVGAELFGNTQRTHLVGIAVNEQNPDLPLGADSDSAAISNALEATATHRANLAPASMVNPSATRPPAEYPTTTLASGSIPGRSNTSSARSSAALTESPAAAGCQSGTTLTMPRSASDAPSERSETRSEVPEP